MNEYIQVKTGLGKAVVTAVGADSTLRIENGRSGDTSATTYLDVRSALLLATSLLAAANHLDPLGGTKVNPTKATGEQP